MSLQGQHVDGGINFECPSKCAMHTVVPGGVVTNLPKNFALLDIVQDVRERSSSVVRNRSPSLHHQSLSGMSSSTSNCGGAEEYECDVCETRGATIVCPSCAVCLCVSCSEDIHSRKGYHLHQLVPVMEYYINSMESFSSSPSMGHRSGSESDILSSGACKHHTDELTEYECEACCEEICRVCLLSGEHLEHETRLLTDIASDKKEALKRAVHDIDDCHGTWNKGFDACHEMQEHLYDRSRNLETDIKTHFHAIHSLLHAKEEGLLSSLREEVESRVKSLKTQAK